MEKIIIRTTLGDEEIRYHVKITNQEYERYLKILIENPGIDKMKAFAKAQSIEEKELDL